MPNPRWLLVAVAALLSHDTFGDAPATGSVTGTVSIEKNKSAKADRSRVVVYLTGVPGTLAPSKGKKIAQKDAKFDPLLTVVVKGTTIDFPNQDKIFHNVFSMSDPATFDLGLYKEGTTKSVTFKRAGVVDIYCNIHPDMVAKVKVLDSNYFQVTGADGKFKIEHVPAGTYPIVAWQANGQEFHGEVTVKAGAAANIDIKLVETEPTKKHLRKDGTPYGRYK